MQTPNGIRNIYLLLTLLNTLAASFIWGVNTIFLLNAGLSNFQAFAANAFFTVGQVLFEIPTGIVADTWGRKVSYILGTLTLALSTFLYLLAWQYQAPFWIWAVSSMFLGLGFTFFSGATEAWLVDALEYTGFKGNLESIFAKGQIVGGIAMLSGSILGGVIAQITNLGVPYIIRTIVLIINFLVALFLMKDLGFTPRRSANVLKDMKQTLVTSVDVGLKKPTVRWIMLAAPFTMGVSFYAFYAMQPYLLDLYGDQEAYAVAGLAAAITGGAQIVGGMIVPYVRRLFKTRTSAMATIVALGSITLVVIGLTNDFYLALFLLVLWGLGFSAMLPIRQAYLNGLIPSKQRATVISSDSLLASSGGVIIQPALGRAADVWSYSTSYLFAAGIQAIAIPFIFLAKREKPSSDPINLDNK